MTEDSKPGVGTAATGSGNEVMKRTGKRQFSNAYRIRIVEEADRCQKPGEIAALMRREGLYSSCLSRFRKQYAAGVLTGGPEKRKAGSKAECASRLAEEDALKRVLALERENRRLRRSLSQAEVLLEIQKKVSELMGISLPERDETD